MTIYDMNTMTQMKHNIIRMMVLCMVMMCGAGTAWGQAVLETVGATDFSTAYLREESITTKQTLNGDGTVHFKFVNHGDKAQSWDNFILVVRSVAAPSNPLVLLRADNWEVVSGSNAGISNNYDLTNFGDLMDGATVDMNITRSGTSFAMSSTITTAASNVYSYSYTNANLPTGAITIGLSVEKAYLEVLEASSTPADPTPGSTATLVHTASVQGGSNEAHSYLDTETHYYNNWGTSAWVAQAFAAFNINIPTGYKVKSATYRVHVNCTRDTRTFDIGYLPFNQTLDFDAIGNDTYRTLWTSTNVIASYSDITTTYVWKEVDVRDLVRAMQEAGSNTLTFIMSNGAAGGNIHGKGSAEFAPELILELVDATKLYDYTVNYLYSGTPIKDPDHGSDILDEVIEISHDPVWKDGVKYIYVSDDATDNPISEGGSTITVQYRVAEQYSYSVRNDHDQEIANGTLYEGESTDVSYPEYILDGTTLYSVPLQKMGGDYFRVHVAPTQNNFEVIIPYDGPQVNNVVYYTEGENVEGTLQATNELRASNGHMGYTASADTYLPLTQLKPGIYEIHICGVNGNAATRTVNFKVGERVLYTTGIPSSVNHKTHSDYIYVGEESTLYFACDGTSASGLDNVYVLYVGSFEPTPVYTLNLRAGNGAIADVSKTLSVHADNAYTYTWYKSDTENGTGEIVQNAATEGEGGNRFSFTHEKNTADTYYYCIATGYSGVEVKSNVTKVKTVNDPVQSAFVTGYVEDYESSSNTKWTSQNATTQVENHDGSKMVAIKGENANGMRTAYLPLTDDLLYKTPDHVSNDWQLDFDFYPVNNDLTPTDQALQIYKEGTTIGTTGQTAGNNMPLELNDCFITFDCNNTNNLYSISIAGVSQSGNITLTPGAKYHVSIKILESTMTRAVGGQMTVSVEDASGNPVYSYEGTSPFGTEDLLGGIMYVMPRRNIKTAHAYFDNITLKVMTTDLAINSDLPEFLEGNDDYYLNDGEGLNFDVPAATEFEWYVSDVAPSKDADGVDAPRLNDDGSVTWTGHQPFMTVQSPVDRSSTTITKTRGVATNEGGNASGKHAVAPAEDNEGKYAMQLKTQYPTVKTVWDEATEFGGVKRYYPEATASGSRWHYLRQLDVQHAEADHLDYVWCVAKNPLGEVTSKVSQINTYPMMPQIYLEDEYLTENANGSRADMTLPAIYKFRTHSVKIHAQNLIFNTAKKPVPYATRSIIHYKDEALNTYEPNEEVASASTLWKYNDEIWSGVISTTTFTYFDETLDANASVHGFYKSIPVPLPVDFAYGLLQQRGMPYHDITKGTEHNSIAEYVIGPRDNVSLQATQDIHFDYGRYTSAEVQLQPVSTKTVWDWSKLPKRKFLTYNTSKYTAKSDTLYTVGGVRTYVVDPDTKLAGPEMGNEYVMANFYGYGADELGGFPSNKVKIGLEYVNNPTEQCMQGNAFIIKPALTGILDISFSTTDSGEQRYLTLTCDDKTVTYNTKPSDTFAKNTATDVSMSITSDMVGKEVIIKACKSSDNTSDQYFRIYSATYTPDAATVTAKEYIADPDKVDIQGADTYSVVETPAFDANGMGNTDGFVSLHAADGAKIKYKLYDGTAAVDEITAALNGTGNAELKNAIDALETFDYNPEAYTDNKGNKIGIHVRVNSTIIAWAEMPDMNNSEPLVYETHAATYPVDLRFMYNFMEKPDPDTENKIIEYFNNTYWGTGTDAKTREASNAPKAWNNTTKFQIGDAEYTASDFADVKIDGVPYTADNFDKFYITHGTVIDINVMAKDGFQFDGFGAPAVGKVGGNGDDKDKYTINDMMRARAATKYARYHLLYDKAKAKNTNYIAFLIANFKDLEGKFTAQIVMKEGSIETNEPTYTSNVVVNDNNEIVAPIYHSAHAEDGKTVEMWTEDHTARNANNIVTGEVDNEIYTSYLPGETKKIYENTFIKPVYRDNTTLDNYRGRSREMTATWWFTTDHHAQPLSVKNEYAGFNMPYVAPVPRHEIGTASEFLSDGVTPNPDDLWFDFPMTITPTATGRVENTIVPDWCSVGRGTRFTMPACKDAVVQMEVRTPLSDAETGTKFGGETPHLIKVKVKRANTKEYYEVDDVNSVTLGDTIYSYTYEATYTGNAETLDVVIGSDYSYIRNISLTLPVIISKRDAALVTLDFSELYPHLLPLDCSQGPSQFPYGQGHTGDGYEFDHLSQNISLYKTHYSGEDGAIYYDGVSPFMVIPGMGMEVADNVPYVNGILGYTYSTGVRAQDNLISQSTDNGAFIVGPFRSITHIRYKQGSSLLEGGGWTMSVGRKNMNWIKSDIQQGEINVPTDPRRDIPNFSQVEWGAPKMGVFHNSTAPEWVEMDIEEHIYPNGTNNSDISLIEDDNYDNMDGDIWLRFQADKPNVYLFAIEIYGIASTSEQQVTLRTNNMVAANDDATDYEPTFIAGDIFHFPYLLHLDESYNPVSRLLDTEDKVLQFNEGREVTLTANPNTGYDFLKWIEWNEETKQWDEVSRENPYKFNINKSTQVRAVFVPRGIINYTAQGTRYGLVPEPVQTDRRGGFTVAENRSLYAADGQSLRRWLDTEPMNEWYTGAGAGQSNSFAVSTNMVSGSTPSVISRSRGELGTEVDVQPEFSDNTLSLLDIVGRIGATARWQFGKKNGAPTMEGDGTTPRLVTQVSVTGQKDILDEENHTISNETVTDTIDVSMEIHANVNNAGRADAYATVDNGATFTLPSTKGVRVEIGTSTTIQYSMDGGTTWTVYNEPFHIYKTTPTVTLQLRNATNTGDGGSLELEYIQATYHQRAQKPVLSMQNVDVIDDPEHHATNNVQVQVQTNSNPTAVRFYTIDGSDPSYIVEGNTMRPTGTTRQVRGNYITINETQIGSGTTLKVLSVCTDRPDSEIATLDLEPYDKNLGLATYVYDSRIINIHEDQIFKKLKADHKGHFNLLSYDLNPSAAVIPSVITDHTTVFITSDAVRDHLTKVLTDPSDPAAHGQSFTVKPLIVGTPLNISWKQSAAEGEWIQLPWSTKNVRNPDTPTSPATITYTEYLRAMKTQATRVDPSQTYTEYYHDQIQAAGGQYVLAFYDGMLIDGSEVCISNTTDNAPEHLSANGTQLLFNATELLTRITEVDGVKTPADVSTFNSTVATLMAPSKNPQLIDVKMSYTKEVIDFEGGDSEGWIAMDAPMLSDLSDGLSVMTMPYLSKTYPQFVAGTIAGKGQVKIQNVETYHPGGTDNIATAEKLGAQGIKDLATIITVTNKNDEVSNYGLDPNFKREYRIEYHIALDSLTFYKKGDQWICDENDICTITESKNANGDPLFKLLGPINSGIKDVCFNGYAVAPASKFNPVTGELLPDDAGQHNNTIWGQGEKFNNDDLRPSPSAYLVDGTFIPEYPEGSDEEKHGLPEGQWMVAHFPWGFENNYQMAFSLLNITDYKGEIKVRFYRQQVDAPELIETNIYDNMKVPANGDFVMKFNTIMHQVRVPGTYDDGTVTWAAHIIPDDLGGDVTYGSIKNDVSKIDEYDVPGKQIQLTAEGGTNTLTFQYWRLEEGKKYWLHIPFHILRSDVGEGVPYAYDTENPNEYEQQMSWTNYVGTDSKAVPYFDIPFTVMESQYNHKVFDYIVDNDNWWDAFKEDGKAFPDYAKWDGTFLQGIDKIQEMAGRSEHPRFYMHVQKQKDGGTYNLGTSLLQIEASNFSIVGEGQDSTIVTAEPKAYDDSDYRGLRVDVSGNQTATLHLDASDVYMQDLTLQNTQKGLDQDGQEYPALFVHGDRNTFYNVNIDGYEESFASFGTLTYLERCKVSGHGDFIVGHGDVWLEQCKIILRDKHMINLCAPATKATEKWGFVFNDCHIDREEGADNVLDHNWTLARPWGGFDEAEVLKSPAVTFLNTKLTVLPANSGYAPLTDGLRLRFHEYGSYKNIPENKAPLSMRSVANCNPTYDSDYPVLNEEQAAGYSIRNVFGRDNNGYDPQALTRQAKAPVLTNDGMVLHWRANPEDLCYLVYYLGDGEEPDYQNAMMFCCVPGTNEEEAYCYLTNHDESPIFRTGSTDNPKAFLELWYEEMGKEAPSRLWFAVRAANQMGGLSEMSDPLMYHTARQYRTTIKKGGVLKGDESGKAYSTIYLDFQARAPRGVEVYALTDVYSKGGDDNGTGLTTLTFTRVNDDDKYQDVVYPDQGYLIYGSYGTGEQDYVFVETTSIPRVELTSSLSGTVGEFKNSVSEAGYGELNGVNGEIGWSISDKDYDNVPRVNISAFTLQKYNYMLGFYKYTGTNFSHHRAYLNTDVAAEMLMKGEGMSQADANDAISRGMRFVIRKSGGEEVDITPVFFPNDEAIYDLTGKRLSGRSQMLPGHIYIVNGRKVMP